MVIEESLKAPARVWQATMRGLREDTSSEELYKIQAPTLIAWGDQDQLLARRDQELLLAVIAHARRIVYPGAGHMFYLERPELVAVDLIAFVESLPRETPRAHGRVAG